MNQQEFKQKRRNSTDSPKIEQDQNQEHDSKRNCLSRSDEKNDINQAILLQQMNQKTLMSNMKNTKKRKNKKFLLDSLSSSEKSLEDSIQDLIGNSIYHNLIESYNQFNHSILQPGWKISGWDLEDNPTSSHQHIQVLISTLSSFGDGIAISPLKNWTVVVPFCVPGDVVETKIYRHTPTHSLGDLIRVIKPGELRNDELIRCQYFGKCSGCQFQMIDYSKQLEIKKATVQNAFQRLSGLDPTSIPTVENTLASPKQYEYRTKLTPHFDLPRKKKSVQTTCQAENEIKEENNDDQIMTGELAIGLMEKGRRKVVDIEECVLGTQIINEKLKTERARVRDNIDSFKRGATLLLRESLVPDSPGSSDDTNEVEMKKICVTNHKTIVREKVLDKFFEQNAGSFFQNNPSILGPFIQYIIEELIPDKKKVEPDVEEDQERYLVDAYCGSGLFSISLAHHFTKTIGIELSSDSLFYAKQNAKLNNIKNASFIVGEAENIFKDLEFPPNQTTIIIDPPRKGCSIEFLKQLKEYKAKKIIYVSCNVMTQAQDVNHIRDVYRLERIRGLDFFPQTYHCESVAVLNLIHS